MGLKDFNWDWFDLNDIEARKTSLKRRNDDNDFVSSELSKEIKIMMLGLEKESSEYVLLKKYHDIHLKKFDANNEERDSNMQDSKKSIASVSRTLAKKPLNLSGLLQWWSNNDAKYAITHYSANDPRRIDAIWLLGLHLHSSKKRNENVTYINNIPKGDWKKIQLTALEFTYLNDDDFFSWKNWSWNDNYYTGSFKLWLQVKLWENEYELWVKSKLLTNNAVENKDGELVEWRAAEIHRFSLWKVEENTKGRFAVWFTWLTTNWTFLQDRQRDLHKWTDRREIPEYLRDANRGNSFWIYADWKRYYPLLWNDVNWIMWYIWAWWTLMLGDYWENYVYGEWWIKFSKQVWCLHVKLDVNGKATYFLTDPKWQTIQDSYDWKLTKSLGLELSVWTKWNKWTTQVYGGIKFWDEFRDEEEDTSYHLWIWHAFK